MFVRREILLTALISSVLSIVIAFALLSVTSTSAQGPTPATENGGVRGPVRTSADPGADSKTGPGVKLAQPNAVAATFSYFRLAGTAFQPRDSVTAYAYDAVGCIHRTAGTGYFSADVHLPEGGQVKYLRFYYNNVVAGDSGTVYLTTYTGGSGGITDMAGTPSGTALGFGSTLSAEITHTVANEGLAYVINWLPGTAANQICGIRLAYYGPTFALDLPMVPR